MNLRWIEAAVVLAILGCIAWFVCPYFGSTHYFSPDSLESGYRSTVTLWDGPPVYRSKLKPRERESKLIQYLIVEGYWEPTNPPTPRWIVTSNYSGKGRGGRSSFHREFYAYDDEWVQWTEQHPKRAAALWPQVLNVLRNEPMRGHSDVIELMYEAKYEASPSRAVQAVP